MPDPYKPLLTSIKFTVAEKAAIAAALKTAKPWNWKPGGAQEVAIKSVKAKIRDLPWRATATGAAIAERISTVEVTS